MLAKQIRLEKWATTQDGNGNNIEAITVKYNLWANVKRTAGQRVQVAGKIELSSSIKFSVRFRPDFNPSGNWRVVYNGNRHTVQSIVQDEEKRFYWTITADSQAMR